MKKTGLPLAYPNIPQLSRAAAFPPDTRFPRRGTGGGEPRAAARAHANEKARTHRAGLFHSVWLSPSLRQRICSIPQCLRCCQMFLTSSSLRRCRWLSLPIRASPGGGREGRALRRSAWLSPFAAVSSAAPWRKTRSVAALMSRRAAGSPHAAGVGVSSRSPVSRVRRAASRLLLAAVHRAVLHLGRRCSLWQSSTT